MRFAIVLLATFLTACATPRQPGTCPDLSGSYVLDRHSCTLSEGRLALPVEVARYPDDSIMDIRPEPIEIRQTGCERVEFSAGGRPFLLDAVWQNGSLFRRRREWSNLPPPIAIGAHGDWFWRLQRASGGDLLYTSGYIERGLFFFVPYRAHREIQCPLRRK